MTGRQPPGIVKRLRVLSLVARKLAPELSAESNLSSSQRIGTELYGIHEKWKRGSPADLFDQVPIGARAETVGEEIDQGPNLRRKMPRLGIDGAQRHILNDEFVERRRQQTRLQVSPHDERGKTDDAQALQRRNSQEIPVVRAEPSC